MIAAAEVNPRRVKAVLNDINLQWSMLVNSDQARDIQRPDFIRWNAIWRAAPPVERQRIIDLDNKTLRCNYVRDALLYAQGKADENGRRQFQEYDGRDFRRLHDVLRKISRLDYDEQVLDAFIYLAALPEKKPAAAPERTLEKEKIPEDISGQVLETVPGSVPAAEILIPVSIGTSKTWGEIEFVQVSKGPFRMGSRSDDKMASDNEKDQHTLDLAYDYWIARFPVTTAQYARFSVAEKTKGAAKKTEPGPKDKLDHPVVDVNWHAALAYCQWLNETFNAELPAGLKFVLPSEAEWEKAARGIYGNIYPWGNEFDLRRCNSAEGGVGGTTVVGKYSPAGDSPFGAAEMAGNVWEWTRSIYRPYPYVPGDGREGLAGGDRRVLRGGAFSFDAQFLRCASRFRYFPDYGAGSVGFRVVVSPFS